MTKHILGIVAIALLMFIGTNDSFAQNIKKETLTPAQQKEAHKQSRHKSYLDVWQQRLDLTNDQVAAIKPIFDKYVADGKVLKTNTELTHDEKKAASIALRQAYDVEFKKHLTEEQKEKLDQYSTRRGAASNSKK